MDLHFTKKKPGWCGIHVVDLYWLSWFMTRLIKVYGQLDSCLIVIANQIATWGPTWTRISSWPIIYNHVRAGWSYNIQNQCTHQKHLKHNAWSFSQSNCNRIGYNYWSPDQQKSTLLMIWRPSITNADHMMSSGHNYMLNSMPIHKFGSSSIGCEDFSIPESIKNGVSV